MEAVKNRLTRLGRNAGSFVVDADSDLIADARNGNFHEAACGREADRIIDDRVDCASEPVGFPHNRCRVLARSCEGQSCVTGFAARLPAVNELLDERTQIDSLEPRPRKLRICTRSLANVADQAVEAADILPDDLSKLFAQLRVFDPIESIDSGSQRCERVLELMGDVGGERLDVVDAVPQ